MLHENGVIGYSERAHADMRTFGFWLLGIIVLASVAAPDLAPHTMDRSFGGLLNAPPTLPHLRDDSGAWHLPFIYRWRLTNQLEQQYEQDRESRVRLAWFSNGRVVSSSDDERMPLMLLGTDSFGRDVFSRLLYGGRLSLALAASLGSRRVAAWRARRRHRRLQRRRAGRRADACVGFRDRAAGDVCRACAAVGDAARARRRSRSSPVLTAIFAIVGAPFIARGVRAIVRPRNNSTTRSPRRHSAPATRACCCVISCPRPAGSSGSSSRCSFPPSSSPRRRCRTWDLGFPDPVASWGTMLQDASSIRAFADFPWLLSPAAAMFLLVLGLNLVVQPLAIATLALQ